MSAQWKASPTLAARAGSASRTTAGPMRAHSLGAVPPDRCMNRPLPQAMQSTSPPLPYGIAASAAEESNATIGGRAHYDRIAVDGDAAAESVARQAVAWGQLGS